MSATIDRRALLDSICEHIRGSEAPTWGGTAEVVADAHGVAESTVDDELAKLEREGFLYRVGDGDTAEVRLP